MCQMLLEQTQLVRKVLSHILRLYARPMNLGAMVFQQRPVRPPTVPLLRKICRRKFPRRAGVTKTQIPPHFVHLRFHAVQRFPDLPQPFPQLDPQATDFGPYFGPETICFGPYLGPQATDFSPQATQGNVHIRHKCDEGNHRSKDGAISLPPTGLGHAISLPLRSLSGRAARSLLAYLLH